MSPSDQQRDEDTVRSARVPGADAQAPAHDAADDLDDTVLGTRRPSEAGAMSMPDDVEHTVMSARVRAAEPVDDVEHTVMSARVRAVSPSETDDADDTVMSVRGSREAADDDDTIALRRRGPVSATADVDAVADSDDAVLRWSHSSDDSAARTVAPLRTPREPLIDDEARRRIARTVEPAILRAPYRPREVNLAPVNRLQPVPHEVREPVDTAAADSRRRADSRRTLVVVLVAGGVIVLAGIAGIVALLTVLH